MFPLGDATRQPSRFPIITTGLIIVNSLVFLLELAGGDTFVLRWSLVPAEIVSGHHLETVLTAMFLHASWSHILGNMLFLWAFGPEIEDAMGPRKYLVFYLLGGLAATLAQSFADPGSSVPNLGASGAIAAVMGAFLVTYPRDQIRTVILLGIFVTVRFIPAALLIGFWFLMQLISIGVISAVGTGGVAYFAHIGGAVFGALAARLFEERARISGDGPGGDPR
jgi:membrane associated rhomboid family serine protease